MVCNQCGEPSDSLCRCHHGDLLGFLSDFRTAQVEVAVRQRVRGEASAGRGPARPGRGATRGATLALDRPDDQYHDDDTDREWTAVGAGPPAYHHRRAGGSSAQAAPTPFRFQDMPVYAPAPDYTPPQTYGGPATGRRFRSVTTRRRTYLRIGAAVGAGIVLAGAALVVVPRVLKPTLSGKTAAQVLAKTVAAARHAGTMHVSATFSQSGHSSVSVLDVGPNGATGEATEAGLTVHVVFVDGTVYLNAPSAYLHAAGLSPQLAQQWQGQWLSIPEGAGGPDVFTASTVVDNLVALGGPLSRADGGGDGTVHVSGTIPDTAGNAGSGAGDPATLTVSRAAPFYPATLSFADAHNGSANLTFSNWGEHLVLAPPAGATPLSSIVPTNPHLATPA